MGGNISNLQFHQFKIIRSGFTSHQLASGIEETFNSIFSSNSEVFVSELLENFDKMHS